MKPGLLASAIDPTAAPQALDTVGGYEVREPYPGEMDYFKANPTVAGMAAEDGRIVLNPFSSLSVQEQRAVAENEAARLFMRERGITPEFGLTEAQVKQFEGTEYGKPENEAARRQTIGARIVSGDPSALDITPEQQQWADDFKAATAARYGKRPDGTAKGRGWLGELRRPDGRVSTELSIQFDDVLDGAPFPLLVPGLTPEEVDTLLTLPKGKRPPDSILDKAIEHAERRAAEGLSPFASPEESLR